MDKKTNQKEMISCIICSRSAEIQQELKENINATIGCDYELVVIDNSANKYSIFSAYNEGVRRAKGDILCFMHEDIEFLSVDWGKSVTAHFCNASLGVLGVVGGHCLPACPCSWWSARINSGRIWQGVFPEEYLSYKKDLENSIQVAAVDGLWMCIPKKAFNTIRFDDRCFNGFHSYDTDICMQALTQGYEIRVAFDIDIRHISKGIINAQYFDARNAFFHKWKDELPIVRGMELRQNEMEERQELVKLYVEAEEAAYRSSGVYNSRAYRLGKTFLCPIKWIRKAALECHRK